MVRKFYDIVYMEHGGGWEKVLGYEKIFTTRDWVNVSGEKNAAKSRAKKARRDGLIPVFLAEDIDAAKEGSWVEGSIMDVRTGIDMQVVNVMAEKGVAAMITLDYLRSGSRALQNAALAVRLLHRGRVPVILSTGAKQENELRGPREVAAVGRMLGMSIPMALASVSDNWGAVL